MATVAGTWEPFRCGLEKAMELVGCKLFTVHHMMPNYDRLLTPDL